MIKSQPFTELGEKCLGRGNSHSGSRKELDLLEKYRESWCDRSVVNNRENHVRGGWRGRQGLDQAPLMGLGQGPRFHSYSEYLFREDIGRSEAEE